MGGICPVQSNHQKHVLICGLKGTGKTTLLYTMKLGKRAPEWQSTNAFNHEIVPYTSSETNQKFEFRCWDVAGKKELIPLWSSFYSNIACDFVLFVIEATKREECIVRARPVFLHLLNENELRDQAQFIIIANHRKASLRTSSGEIIMNPDEIRDALGVDSFGASSKGIQIHYIDTKNATGLKQLMDRLCGDRVDEG